MRGKLESGLEGELKGVLKGVLEGVLMGASEGAYKGVLKGEFKDVSEGMLCCVDLGERTTDTYGTGGGTNWNSRTLPSQRVARYYCSGCCRCCC